MPRNGNRPSITDVAMKRRVLSWLDVGIQNQRGNKRRKLPSVVGNFQAQLHYQDRPEAKKKLVMYLGMVEKTVENIKNEIKQL